MFPLVAFPAVVDHYAPHFAAVFSPAAFIQFKRYISGLLVSENKTVDGINRLFVVESRHQSSLNRLLTASPFTLTDLNDARLAVLQAVPGTHEWIGMAPDGIVIISDGGKAEYKTLDGRTVWPPKDAGK